MFRGIRKKYDGLRRKYPEVHGKLVDYITHSIDDGPLYFSVRFADNGDVGRSGGDRICSPTPHRPAWQ
jgi:hypothetical protein